MASPLELAKLISLSHQYQKIATKCAQRRLGEGYSRQKAGVASGLLCRGVDSSGGGYDAVCRVPELLK